MFVLYCTYYNWVSNSFGVAHAVAFDAENLSTVNTVDLLTKVTKSVVIHGFDFPAALEHALRLCPGLGKHSGLYHFTPHCTMRYVWAHKEYQPWGKRLPVQCPQCGVLNTWSSASIGGGGYKFACTNDGCGIIDGRRQKQRHSITVNRPEDSHLLNVSKDAAWLRTPVVF
jgi:hypothetical protein